MRVPILSTKSYRRRFDFFLCVNRHEPQRVCNFDPRNSPSQASQDFNVSDSPSGVMTALTFRKLGKKGLFCKAHRVFEPLFEIRGPFPSALTIQLQPNQFSHLGGVRIATTTDRRCRHHEHKILWFRHEFFLTTFPQANTLRAGVELKLNGIRNAWIERGGMQGALVKDPAARAMESTRRNLCREVGVRISPVLRRTTC
jgi:hypothetical protein